MNKWNNIKGEFTVELDAGELVIDLTSSGFLYPATYENPEEFDEERLLVTAYLLVTTKVEDVPVIERKEIDKVVQEVLFEIFQEEIHKVELDYGGESHE